MRQTLAERLGRDTHRPDPGRRRMVVAIDLPVADPFDHSLSRKIRLHKLLRSWIFCIHRYAAQSRQACPCG